jgi:uncharacterized protein YuzE
MITLFHGTTAKAEIIKGGFNTELVFLTARMEVAEMYAEEVVSVVVDEDDLLIDLDQPGAIGLKVEQANRMTDNDFSCAEDYLDAGFSVCIATKNIKRVN